MAATTTTTPLSLYQQFKSLHEEELYDSLTDLGDLLLTTHPRPRNQPAQREFLKGAKEEFRCLVLYAYALVQEHRYRQAVDVYGRVCNMLLHTYPPPGSAGRIGGRATNGPKVEAAPGTPAGFERLFTEDDIKYRFAQAYVFLDDPEEALQVLDTIPPLARTAKVNVLMMKLNASRPNYALDKMKQLVKQAPLAIRVLRTWFQCGGKLNELNANLGKNVAEEKFAAHLNKLIHCHSYMFSGSLVHAYQAATCLQEDPVLAHNPTLMILQAKCQGSLGHVEHAVRILDAIDHAHANYYQDMDEYAAILYERAEKRDSHTDNSAQILQKLADRLLKCANLAPETWVVKGYNAMARKDWSTAAKYAEHAVSLDDARYRSHVLRGLYYYKKDDPIPAQRSIRRALDLAPTCLDAHKYLIELYQKNYGEKETVTAAANMYKLCKKNPRSVQVYAEAMIHHNYRLREVAVILEKHMKAHPSDQKVGILLAAAFEKLKSPERAVEILKRQLMQGNSKEIHESLSRLYKTMDDSEKEAEHSNLAAAVPWCNLDPRADSPMPGPSSGFRSSSPGSPRTSGNEDDGGNDDSDAEDDDDEESVME
ncbi:putative Anaphase-promoting complex subunit 7 [Hypsibius exemplaris]|uniref:Anaphase-promoting complex subunit 7 n=1 Tax=Hypsibius exemplaris TaxID=2072580 RepID=A0A1W0WSU6_HYPEX|nr:putative Anaphase-promoting complex subunit 7 [Hypsibius exemplaris]